MDRVRENDGLSTERSVFVDRMAQSRQSALFDLFIHIECLNNRMYEYFTPIDVEADLAQMEAEAKQLKSK